MARAALQSELEITLRQRALSHATNRTWTIALRTEKYNVDDARLLSAIFVIRQSVLVQNGDRITSASQRLFAEPNDNEGARRRRSPERLDQRPQTVVVREGGGGAGRRARARRRRPCGARGDGRRPRPRAPPPRR